MSKVVVTTVLPDSGASDLLTIGAASDSVAISGDSLNVDTLQDAGGNTIFISDGSGTITSKNSVFSGALKLITTNVSSGASSSEFSLDSTYDVYCFKFIDINPSTNIADLNFDCSVSGSYGTTKTTAYFYAAHGEGGEGGTLSYYAGYDLAQSTLNQIIAGDIGNGGDECASGELYLFAPSSTTYVKHFYSRCQEYHDSSGTGYSLEQYVGGYFNTTSALDGARFQIDTGTFDGTIKMYGISKS